MLRDLGLLAAGRWEEGRGAGGSSGRNTTLDIGAVFMQLLVSGPLSK